MSVTFQNKKGSSLTTYLVVNQSPTMSIATFDPNEFTFSDPKKMDKVAGNMGYINYAEHNNRDVHFQLRRARTPFGFSAFGGDSAPTNPNKKSFKYELTDGPTLEWMQAFDEHTLNFFLENKEKMWSYLGDDVKQMPDDVVRKTFNPCARYPQMKFSEEFDYTKTPNLKLNVYLQNEKRKCTFSILRKVYYTKENGDKAFRYDEEPADESAVTKGCQLIVRIAPVSYYVGSKGWGVNWAAVKIGVFESESAPETPGFELDAPIVQKKRALDPTDGLPQDETKKAKTEDDEPEGLRSAKEGGPEGGPVDDDDDPDED